MKYIKQILIKVLLFGLLAVSFSSCNHMLDIDSKDAVDTSYIYKSIKNFEYGVNGAYNDLLLEHNALIGSILADECSLAPDNFGVDGYAVNLFRWEYSSDDDIILEAWRNYYRGIYRVNLLLENSSKVPLHNQEEKDRMVELMAELKGLRALVHFELHRLFGQGDYSNTNLKTIPYITDIDINKKPSGLKTNEFYSKLWKDIDDAILDLDDDVTYVTNISKDAMHALGARVALYQRDYDKAINFSTELIGKYPLATQLQFVAMLEDHSNTEVIFKLKRNNENEVRPNTLWYNFHAGKANFLAATKVMDLYEDQDVRLKIYFGEDNQIAKYSGEDNENKISDYKVFRVSEMYLIRAEAYLKKGQNSLAIQDVNNLISKRIHDSAPIEKITLDVVLTERYKELTFEGHRYFDLKRLSQEIERDKLDAINLSTTTLSPLDEAYQLPIPQQEVLANPNLK